MAERTQRAPMRRQAAVGHVSPRLGSDLIADFTSALDQEILMTSFLKSKGPLTHPEQVALEYKEYALMYLKEQWLSKYVVLSKDGALERRQAAINKWLMMELRNGKTNIRLLGLPVTICGVDTDKLLSWSADLIEKTIGPKPHYAALMGSFSGGASTSQGRKPGAIASKFGENAEVTAEAWETFKSVMTSSPLWLELSQKGVYDPKKAYGNELFTVPKNSKIDRVAAKEPDLNMFAQKGIGNFIRSRLRSQGVDLNDQTVNQSLAKIGSRDNVLATIDLSSASDTVCHSLVHRLLPEQWYDLLDTCRSRRTRVDGVYHELNMFSSMGNGFTFELESLIFWALARGIAYLKGIRGRINVYGDDIIVPSQMYPMMEKFLSYFGFIMNKDKSFGKGPFRESCGKHYFQGCDVTPFFLRHPIEHQSQLILFLNQLTNWMRTVDGELVTMSGEHVRVETGFPFFNEFWTHYHRKVDRRFRGGSVDWISSDRVLVSSDQPQSMLLRAVREVRLPDDGAYLHWLHVRDDDRLWPSDGSFIGPWVKPRAGDTGYNPGRAIWRKEGAFIKHLTLSEALITTCEAVTLEARWVVRPYRDVTLGDDLRS